MKLAKTLMAMVAVALFSGCGPQDEEMGAQEQEQGTLSEQTSALNGSDPVLGNWAWAGGTSYKVTVDGNGTGVQVSSDCFNGTVAWKNITFFAQNADGTKIYNGKYGNNPTRTPYCYWTTFVDVRFWANSNWQNMTIKFPSGYQEAYIRW